MRTLYDNNIFHKQSNSSHDHKIVDYNDISVQRSFDNSSTFLIKATLDPQTEVILARGDQRLPVSVTGTCLAPTGRF